MTTRTSLGSAGARAVLGAAQPRRVPGMYRGWRRWEIGELSLECVQWEDRSEGHGWRLDAGGDDAEPITRDTARLLLAGLLLPAAVAELLVPLKRAREHCAGWALTSGAGEPALDDLDDVLVKLRELGLEVKP